MESARAISSPRHAMRLGLGMVQQHFTLIPVFTALQNIVLAKEPCTFGVILDYREAGKENYRTRDAARV